MPSSKYDEWAADSVSSNLGNFPLIRWDEPKKLNRRKVSPAYGDFCAASFARCCHTARC